MRHHFQFSWGRFLRLAGAVLLFAVVPLLLALSGFQDEALRLRGEEAEYWKWATGADIERQGVVIERDEKCCCVVLELCDPFPLGKRWMQCTDEGFWKETETKRAWTLGVRRFGVAWLAPAD